MTAKSSIHCTRALAVAILLVAVQAPAVRGYFLWNESPAVSNSINSQPVRASIDSVKEEARKQALLEKDQAELPQRIHGHLNQLVAHGGSAVRSMVDSVQPDLKNIGKDISDVVQVTRDSVVKRIEPTISSASKSMVPLITQAREEVPKVLTRVGEQMKGVFEKMASPNNHSVQEVVSNLAQQAQKAGETMQNTLKQASQAVQAQQAPAQPTVKVEGSA